MAATDNRSTLVFGIVAATGTPIDRFISTMEAMLRKFGYEPVTIHLTSLLQRFVLETSIPSHNEGSRIQGFMDAGDAFRRRLDRNDAMALLGVLGIQQRAQELGTARPLAFLLRQLKDPEEISTLRHVYGDSFFLISLYSPSYERRNHLKIFYNLAEDLAVELIRRDEDDEQSPHGQKTRDTFELGDFFVHVSIETSEQERIEIERFLDLIFGRPNLSPLPREHAMYMAYASSLRSADLSRQVGAAILSARGDLLAVGANDVPAFRGGPYWPGDADQRDHKLGRDSNAAHRDAIARDIFERITSRIPQQEGLGTYDYEIFRQDIKGSKLFDITEYGRAVHAEMDAILSCARVGAETYGATLYSTTFPCHNCAKHIVDAGIVEVQYVEAYPKSKAEELHSDSICFEDQAQTSGSGSASKVLFRHYTGLGPRRYVDLYSLTLGSGRQVKRKKEVAPGGWDRSLASPRVPSPKSTSEKMDEAIRTLQGARSPKVSI